MGLYEDRVKRLREHVLAQQKKAEQSQKEPELTNKEIMSKLKELNVEYDKKANKTTLLALLEKAQNPDNETADDDPEDDLEDDNEGAE